ncbi:hypothetical protein OG589_13290 [Sphaerisporangium sp. NBC_01403]|uniref:hypothetical protein n=1 Tax=Sphaerisporangium sp. NBC_01403 TaxID=2903599 RepID=UPI00325173E7
MAGTQRTVPFMDGMALGLGLNDLTGAIEYVHWATGTARLLPHLLRGRSSGPVFLAGQRAPVSGPRAPAAADVCSATGRGRLSYPRAEYLFKQASAALDPHGAGWSLHQLHRRARSRRWRP